LYWAETHSGRLHQREIVSPGRIRQPDVLDATACLFGFSGLQLLDSLAVDSAGNVCVGTVVAGGISVVSPTGELIDFVATGDPVTTNICFGGPGLTTAYITASGTGALLAMEWPVPGLKLNHASAVV
jgi:gluconolactonase